LNGYLVGGAWKSAARFYSQARAMVSRDVDFSNYLAPQAWMLGFLEKDEKLMRMAVEDSDSGSYLSMITQTWNCAAHGDYARMEKVVDDLIDVTSPIQPLPPWDRQ